MAASQLKIAIVGAGPSGLALALLLLKAGITATIFDLRQRPTEEELAQPAGSLDLHEETGIAALQGCSLYEEFLQLTGDCTESQVIADKAGNIIYKDEGEGANRPEVSRHKLMKLLLGHLPDSLFKWGWKLLDATLSTSKSGHPQTELDFGANGKHTFDFVVGADGAWSRVRRLLMDVRPEYAGVQNITLNIFDLAVKYPELNELVGTGTFTCLADHKGVFSQRSVEGSARIYLMLSTPDEKYATTHNLLDATPAAAKDFFLSQPLFGTFGPPLHSLISAACADSPASPLDIKPLYHLPVGQSWAPRQGVTLIGDAAHLMCPWAGEGVNLALRDALDLSRAIISAHGTSQQDRGNVFSTLGPLLAKFEGEMVGRAAVEAEGTLENGEMMFGSADGSGAFKAFMESHGPPPGLE